MLYIDNSTDNWTIEAVKIQADFGKVFHYALQALAHLHSCRIQAARNRSVLEVILQIVSRKHVEKAVQALCQQLQFYIWSL